MIVTIDLEAPLFEFYKAGIIQALYKKGNPAAMWYRYYEVFKEHNKEHNRTTSVKLSADECGVSEVTIWKAVKAIECGK